MGIPVFGENVTNITFTNCGFNYSSFVCQGQRCDGVFFLSFGMVDSVAGWVGVVVEKSGEHVSKWQHASLTPNSSSGKILKTQIPWNSSWRPHDCSWGAFVPRASIHGIFPYELNHKGSTLHVGKYTKNVPCIHQQSFTRGTTYWALIYIEGAAQRCVWSFCFTTLFCWLSHSNAEIDFCFDLKSKSRTENMKQFHSWAKFFIKKTCFDCLGCTNWFFCCCGSLVCFLVDDDTSPPSPIGPGLAKTRSGAMSAPVEVGFPVVKMGIFFFPQKNATKNAK